MAQVILEFSSVPERQVRRAGDNRDTEGDEDTLSHALLDYPQFLEMCRIRIWNFEGSVVSEECLWRINWNIEQLSLSDCLCCLPHSLHTHTPDTGSLTLGGGAIQEDR